MDLPENGDRSPPRLQQNGNTFMLVPEVAGWIATPISGEVHLIAVFPNMDEMLITLGPDMARKLHDCLGKAIRPN
jgi:hypothetical protein